MTHPSSAVHAPGDVQQVFKSFYTCEFTTLAADGTPVTWPTVPLYRPAEGTFLVTTSIGLPQKALNVRRDPRVSLLFSEPCGSGLDRPPAVLVQGDATCSDEITTGVGELEELLALIYQRQPASRRSPDPITRRLLDWYAMRLVIHTVPRVIQWWPLGDFTRSPTKAEA